MSYRGTTSGASASSSPRVCVISLWALLVAFAAVFARPAAALSADKSFHNFVRDSWSIEQGLPQIAVQAIAQDHEGYIWAGTLSGLARFDGVRFTTFNPANTPALPSSTIQALHTDRDGRLWIATNKGVAVYRDGRFVTVPVENPVASAEMDVQDILPSASGEVLVATTAGLFRVVNDKLQQDRAVPGPLFSIIESGQDNRWIGGWGGVYQQHGNTFAFEMLPGLSLHDTVQHLVISGSRLWAGTSTGLFVREGGVWQRYDRLPTLASSSIGVLYEDRSGNLWVGTSSGLVRMRNGELVEQIDNERMGTRWEYLTAFEDRENNLWLGSRTRGLTRFWNGLTTRYSLQEGLSSPLVWSVERDSLNRGDSRLWVGTDNGLSELSGNRFRQVLPGSALPDPSVYSLLVEGDDIWIGTLHGAVLMRRGELVPLSALKGLEGLRINGILRDRARRLWFATSNGLFRYAGGALTRFGENEGLSDPSVRVLYQTRDGRLLLGTQFGLAEWLNGEVQAIGAGEGLPNDIDVTAIHELPDRRLVVGTATEQLYVYEGSRWIEFNHDHGLPQNSAFFITNDDKGYLWVAGLRGLYRVPVDDLRLPKDGVRRPVRSEPYGNELSARTTGPRGECCNGAGNSKGLMAGGVLWLPTRDGVLSVPTDTLVRNPVPPTVKVESVSTGGKWISASAFLAAPLPARARDLSFKFSALSYQDPYAVQLEYRLRGYDENWQPVKDSLSRYADYTNLPPGEYVFEVRGANNAGVWSETPAMLAFRITPFFYETIWFYLMIAVIVLTLAYGIHRWRLGSLTRRRAVLETIVAQRTDALALANQQLEQASYTDPLTGLRNRRYLLNQLPQDLAFYRRKGVECYDEDTILLFLLVDIDHFKQINDSHGHGGGDLVLQQFSALLSELVRVGDYVTRWGGEEFLIVSRPLSQHHAISYASRICTVISAHPFAVGAPTPLRLTCSVGFAEYPLRNTPPSLDWQDLVELADRALYHVKETGRNGWAAFRFTAKTPFQTLMRRFKDDRAALLAENDLRLISSRDPLPPDSQAVTLEFKARS